jgi:hypothetical protein
MVQVEVNQTIAQNQQKALAALFIDNPDTRKRIKKIIREELKDATGRVREDATYEMKEDPRKAYKAVKYTVYRKILGGNVSILSPRKAGARYELIKPRTLNPNKPGGNRRTVSGRTYQIETYYGRDRAFILRFLNSGTSNRNIKFTENSKRKVDKWNKHPNTGNRGNIAPRNWFANVAPKEMELACENLAGVIEEELAEAYAEIDKK